MDESFFFDKKFISLKYHNYALSVTPDKDEVTSINILPFFEFGTVGVPKVVKLLCTFSWDGGLCILLITVFDESVRTLLKRNLMKTSEMKPLIDQGWDWTNLLRWTENDSFQVQN